MGDREAVNSETRKHLKRTTIFHKMGCVASCFVSVLFEMGKYDGEVMGLCADPGFPVFPPQGMYTVKEKYLLKIKEKFWTGKEDLVIAGENGRKFVQMKAEQFGKKEELRDLIGLEGVEFAGYVIDKENMTAHVTTKLGKSQKVILTIKQSGRWSRKPILDMYFHNPTVELDAVSTEGMSPALILRGNFPGKDYAMMFRTEDGYSKLAAVCQQWEGKSEEGFYFVDVGTRVDIAMVGICAVIIDELYA